MKTFMLPDLGEGLPEAEIVTLRSYRLFSADVAEKSLYDLKAPIKRVTGFDTVMPLFRLEYDYLPCVERIVDACQETIEE